MSQGVVETLDMIGFASFLCDRFVLSGGNHAFVHHILVRIKRRLLTVCLGNLGPQLLGTLAAAITDVKRNDLSRFDIHCQPNPLLVLLLLDKARHFVGFHLTPLNHHILRTAHGLHVKMIRQSINALHEKAQ